MIKQKRMNRSLALLAVVTFFVFPFYSSNSFAAQKEKRKQPLATKRSVKVIELRKIDQLKEAFQRDTGKIRLVTILSPT